MLPLFGLVVSFFLSLAPFLFIFIFIVAVFMKDCTKVQTELVATNNKYYFKGRGISVEHPGWRGIYNLLFKSDEEEKARDTTAESEEQISAKEEGEAEEEEEKDAESEEGEDAVGTTSLR